MNMSDERLNTLWAMVNDQAEGISREDAEYLAEQWWAEVEWPGETI